MFSFYIYVIGKWRVVLDYAKVKLTGKVSLLLSELGGCVEIFLFEAHC